MGVQGDVAMVGSALTQGGSSTGDGADVNGTAVQLQLTTLPAGEIQQLVDQTDQAVGLALGDFQGGWLALSLLPPDL